MTTPAPPSPDVRVRRAERGDLPAVYGIERSVFPQPWPVAAFERYVGQPGFLVADDDGAVGYIVADVVSGGGHPTCHIKDLAVSPARRREGIASGLLSRALDLLEDRVVRAKLEVRAGNDGAIELYRRHGFSYRRRLPGYYANNEDGLVFVRPV